MESMGAIAEGEWNSLSGMCTIEEADFMDQLLSSFPIHDGFSTLNTTGSSYCSSDIASNGTSSYSFWHSPTLVVANNSPTSIDFCIEDATITSSYPVEAPLPGKNLNLRRETEMPRPKLVSDKRGNTVSENSKKRSRSSGDVQKKRRNSRPKKKQNNVSTTYDGEDEFKNSSEDEHSNASQELNSKTRASKGTASDPQSLYAKKRRESINERLRILQNLVPNGTKVDISTMLEEAVQYVKFLQLQIKMLSSDDLWMYAPIAYNGMGIGLDDVQLTKQG
ncbi:hypothetical protein V6N13_106164 [Hibiscus sabdariffa]|uniref:BHLH domain-containing protein n=1 Tax=Hibiscus sabdariffa TaxID=183260 RepID=A0ABR2EZU2_9ROSI